MAHGQPIANVLSFDLRRPLSCSVQNAAATKIQAIQRGFARRKKIGMAWVAYTVAVASSSGANKSMPNRFSLVSVDPEAAANRACAGRATDNDQDTDTNTDADAAAKHIHMQHIQQHIQQQQLQRPKSGAKSGAARHEGAHRPGSAPPGGRRLVRPTDDDEKHLATARASAGDANQRPFASPQPPSGAVGTRTITSMSSPTKTTTSRHESAESSGRVHPHGARGASASRPLTLPRAAGVHARREATVLCAAAHCRVELYRLTLF